MCIVLVKQLHSITPDTRRCFGYFIDAGYDNYWHMVNLWDSGRLVESVPGKALPVFVVVSILVMAN